MTIDARTIVILGIGFAAGFIFGKISGKILRVIIIIAIILILGYLYLTRSF